VIKEQQELPEGWSWLAIKEFAKTTSGGTPKRGNPEFYNGDVPWVKSGDLNNGILYNVDEYISELGLQKSSAKMFNTNTVLVAMYGATIGKLSILGFSASTNQAICGISLPESFEPKYLFYYLLSIKKKLIEQGQGGAQPNINQQIIKETLVPVAPPAQQKQIVAKIEELFSHIDAGIEGLKKSKALLKQYRQSVLKAAVTGELTKDWRETNKDKIEPASQLLKRILKERQQRWEQQQLEQFQAKGKPPKNDKWKEKYKEPYIDGVPFFREVPESWVETSIDTLAAEVRYGTSSKTNDDSDGVPVIRMGNIVDGMLDYSNLKFLPINHSEFPELLLQDGDLLFNRTNSAELVGKTAVFKDKGKPVSLASYLIRVRLLNDLKPDFFAFFINGAYGKLWIKSCVSQNVGQANVNGTKLKSLIAPLPPFEEQKEIVQRVEEKLTAADRLIAELDTKLTQAQQQKQTILASAFRGELV